MATSLTTHNLTFIFNGVFRKTNDFTTLPSPFDHNWAITLANGTGSGQANFAYHDLLTINASSSSTLNLFSLADDFGTTQTPTIVKVFAVRLYSSSDTSATLSLGGSVGGNEWLSWLANASDLATVRYTGWTIAVAPDATGYAVSNTNKNIKITNNSSTQSVVVEIVVVGII